MTQKTIDFTKPSPKHQTETATNIKPQFDFDGLIPNTISSTELSNHLEAITQQNSETKKERTNTFPLEVFPKPIQDIIMATYESLNFPIDYTASAILFAASVAIGNTHKVEIKKGWTENTVIYIALVGPPGVNKSHPMSFAIQPLNRQDSISYIEFEKQKQAYESTLGLTKKEKETQKLDEPIKPFWKQYLVSDITPESIVDVHKFNPRGIGVYNDELAGWIKNFNRYNKGSEEQFWLSAFSGKPIRVSRKSSDPIYIPLPHISVAGTIQNGILDLLAKENRTETGFNDRILFVIPENIERKYWSDKELDSIISENWTNILSNLMNLPLSYDEINIPNPEILKFSPDAKKLLFEWQKENTDSGNLLENEDVTGIYAKAEIYTLRFCLILQLLLYACGAGDKVEISTRALEGALNLIEYFKKSAIKVQSIITSTNPLEKLPTNKQILYNVLPDTFATNEGVQIAKSKNVSERTFKNFLNNKEIFIKTKRGEYEKKY
jgi:hypothetical protein